METFDDNPPKAYIGVIVMLPFMLHLSPLPPIPRDRGGDSSLPSPPAKELVSLSPLAAPVAGGMGDLVLLFYR
jgi:hypothetical protein